MGQEIRHAEVIVIGGGLAGLSAAVYLARALRSVIVVDEGKSMARWEPDVQNYLGFPNGVSGPELLERAREHARKYGAKFARDEIRWAKRRESENNSAKRSVVRGDRALPPETPWFILKGRRRSYVCQRLLIATGIFHVPPDVPALRHCLGHSMFFCKDCDGYRVQGRRIGIYGWTAEAVEYALGMLLYAPCVVVLTNGRKPLWPGKYERFIKEYHLPVYTGEITDVEHSQGQLASIEIAGSCRVELDALFTTRGDIYHNRLARSLGAKTDAEGGILTDAQQQTTISGLYAAGCITPANCQMIIAAGQGAAAAQAINRDLFEQNLKTHALRRLRQHQVRTRETVPPSRKKPALSGKDPTEKRS